MNKIDKTQFPLPYAQLVKILILLYVFMNPFRLVHVCGNLTPGVAVIVALGFFGMDEVGEILESPFGNDPNDINLRKYGRKLLIDLDMVYHAKNMKLDTVFACEDDFSFGKIIDGHERAKALRARTGTLGIPGESSRVLERSASSRRWAWLRSPE